MEVEIMFAKSILRLLLAVLGTLCFAMPAMSQAQPGTGVLLPPGGADTGLGGGNAITGTVLLSSGQRLQSHVTVRLQTMTKGDRFSVTDDNGTFVFRQLPNGEYTIVIDKVDDHETFRQRVEVRQYNGTPPQNYTLNIRLEPKGGATARTGVLNADLANVPKNALASYKKAQESAQAGKNQEAIDQLQQAISEYPKFMLAYSELGVQYMAVGDLAKAEESLTSALKLKPDAFDPLMNYGITLVRLNRFSEAIPQLRAAIKLKEQSAIGHYYLGRALAYQKRYDDAIAELNLAIQLGGNQMKESHRYLAASYNAKGDKQHAISELEIYLKLAPNSQDADRLRQIISDLRNSK
jgi:tetratricopeptide (TPR) repeat protein